MDVNHDLDYNLEKALVKTNFTIDDLQLMRKKLPENCPKDITDNQLLLFLNACETIEEAINVLKIYYDARKNAPEHFSNRDPKDPTIIQCLENQYYFILPPTKEEGCPYVYYKIANTQASNYFFDNVSKTIMMIIDLALNKYGPCPGIIFLNDMEHVRFSHLIRISLSSMRKLLYYMQYGMPVKIRRIHILNATALFDKLLTIIKPFMKKELIESIYTHQSNIDYNEFSNKWIPKSHLPSDYGGNLKSVEELHNDFCKELMLMRDFFINEEKQRENSI